MKSDYKAALRKINNKDIIGNIENPIIYSIKDYGINEELTGKNVTVAILDSGCPNHKDIKIDGNSTNLCDENVRIEDKNGHATMISGIIAANGSHMKGFAPNSKLIFGKIVNKNNNCFFNTMVAGVLWAIVKGADIIVIALGSENDYVILEDAIKKAIGRDICVFAAIGEDDEINFPAKYKNVFATGVLSNSKTKNDLIKNSDILLLKNKKITTTFLNDSYINAGGSSISTAFFAGIAACLVERYKKENKSNISSLINQELKRIFKGV